MDSRLKQASAILERLALIDEHVLDDDRPEILNQAIRAVGPIPAIALDADTDNGKWQTELNNSLVYCGALCLRVILLARQLSLPSADEVLAMTKAHPGGSGMNHWPAKDPLWGHVANVVFRAAESAAGPHDAEVDCISCTATLKCCIEFLNALHGGDLGK